jgi:hypothetical protein
MGSARWRGLSKLLDVPIQKVGLCGREIELSRRLIDQLAAFESRLVGESSDDPVQGLLDVRLSEAHDFILAFRGGRV